MYIYSSRRDGYRTRVNPNILGPTIEYYLPAAPTGPITIEILDGKGTLVNSYNSDCTGGDGCGRGGRYGGAGAPAEGAEPQQEDPDAPTAEDDRVRLLAYQDHWTQSIRMGCAKSGRVTVSAGAVSSSP